jgi:hypothetical protein
MALELPEIGEGARWGIEALLDSSMRAVLA